MKKQRGISLVEVIALVGLLALLSTAAYARYEIYLLKAARAEAMAGLRGVYAAQLAYRADARRYAGDFASLGGDLLPGEALDPHSVRGQHYTFSLQGFDEAGRRVSHYRAVAAADLDPSDLMMDVLVLEEGLRVHGEAP